MRRSIQTSSVSRVCSVVAVLLVSGCGEERGTGEASGGSAITSATGGVTTAGTSGGSSGGTSGMSSGGGSEGTSGAGTSSGTGTSTGMGTSGEATGTSGDGTSTGTGSSGSSGSTTGEVKTCPPVGPEDCSPGEGNGETCFDAPTCFRDQVKAAVQAILMEHPEWFEDMNGQPYVLEVEAYMNGVVAKLDADSGLCAIRDPNAGDEIAVKHDNEYAESFDILTAQGFARYGDGIYTATCAPAWF